MTSVSPAERRAYRRYPHSGPAEVYHRASGRRFPARCVDASAGGLLLYVPMSAPVQAGQAVEVSLSGQARPELQQLARGSLRGSIARVDRQKLVAMGQLAVGIRLG